MLLHCCKERSWKRKNARCFLPEWSPQQVSRLFRGRVKLPEWSYWGALLLPVGFLSLQGKKFASSEQAFLIYKLHRAEDENWSTSLIVLKILLFKKIYIIIKFWNIWTDMGISDVNIEDQVDSEEEDFPRRRRSNFPGDDYDSPSSQSSRPDSPSGNMVRHK